MEAPMIATKNAAYSPLDWFWRKLPGSKSPPIAWPLLITILTMGSTLINQEAAGQAVAEKTAHGLTCNLDGIPSSERARYTELAGSLRHAIREKRELPDGYALLLDPAQFTMDQALEWTKLERECCPFLEMQVRWDIENGPVWLDLKGPEGVKVFILDEFGLR
jgi:hypothetical protein